MSKKINPEKLTLGIRKDFRKDTPKAINEIETLIKKIHAVSQSSEEETKRTTLDIPKALHKRISRRALDKDLTLKDYFLELAELDLSAQ